MNFNISNIHQSSSPTTIIEEAENKTVDSSPVANTDISTDDSNVKDLNPSTVPDTKSLSKIYDDACPISGEVFNALKETAANPHNVKMVAVKEENSDEEGYYSLYVEASEFLNFSEAAGLDLSEAADTLIDTCKSDCPAIQNAEFHVVFPDDCLNKGILGGENLGVDVKNDWSMQLMRGCRRYGLKTNIGRSSQKDLQESGNEVDNTNEASVFDTVIDKAIDMAEEAKEKTKIMDAAKEYRDKALEEYNKRKKAEKEEKYKNV